MRVELNEKAIALRKLSSEDAATWLMENYPVGNLNSADMCFLMGHRSWKKPEQIQLAKYYLSKTPFANAKPYEVFASFMSIANLATIMLEYVPVTAAHRNILAYHLEPILKQRQKSAADQVAISRLLIELQKTE